ncbi:hypothetical protein CAXC1_220047 [Candidatus Xenohaliotis californiensis]|uniref:fructose-bisphosphatase n=1 Tax=Candidatus Xenohaliotis californiensis TaxID=84677 RepID=A0ABM9N7S6_9RICK|nr:hypothetical protein CAXC1_220047 [Candidatus Xenohaliotis californiensis]
MLAAAAIKCLGGTIQGRLIFNNDTEWLRAKNMGIDNKDKIYTAEEMIKGDTVFIATAITNAMGMNGINIYGEWLNIESIIMCTEDQSITNINNTYKVNKHAETYYTNNS